MTEQTVKWPSFKHEPVRGAIDRVFARALRTARRNMRRFFAERGLHAFVDRLDTIRSNPRLNTAQKRAAFEKVLDEYAKFISGTQAELSSETPYHEETGAVGVSGEGSPEFGAPSGVQRTEPIDGVQQLAPESGGV